MRFSKSWLALSITVLILLLNSGCSKIQFAYNHIGWFVLPKLESYTSFDRKQRRLIESEFNSYMKWHRKTMLPEYGGLLRHVAHDLDDPSGFSVGEAKKLRLEFQSEFERTVDPMLGAAARVLTSLDNDQIEVLAKTLDKEDEKFRKKFAEGTVEQQLARRDEKILKNIEEWAGTLTSDQQMQLRSAALKLPYTSGIWLQTREAWRIEFLRRLRSKQSAVELEAYFRLWVLKRNSMLKPEQKQLYDQLEASIDQLMVDVVKLTTPSQRQLASAKLTAFAQDFDELSAQD